MRLCSTLLIAALGGVVGAAPAAPVQLRQPAAKTKENKDSGKRNQKEIGRVVLRADSTRLSDTTAAGGEAAVTVDPAPALRVRRLPPAPPYTLPVRDLSADVRAGLFDTPPPQA